MKGGSTIGEMLGSAVEAWVVAMRELAPCGCLGLDSLVAILQARAERNGVVASRRKCERWATELASAAARRGQVVRLAGASPLFMAAGSGAQRGETLMAPDGATGRVP